MICTSHLSTAIIDENATALKGISLAHENKIFFPGEETQASQTSQPSSTEKATHKVFIRDTPLRTTQITTAIPNWGAGAAIDKTVGPFVSS